MTDFQIHVFILQSMPLSLLWGWSNEHLCELLDGGLKQAQEDYNHYLGDGNPTLTTAQNFFHDIREQVSIAASTAGVLSPSLRALSGTIQVHKHLERTFYCKCLVTFMLLPTFFQ